MRPAAAAVLAPIAFALIPPAHASTPTPCALYSLQDAATFLGANDKPGPALDPTICAYTDASGQNILQVSLTPSASNDPAGDLNGAVTMFDMNPAHPPAETLTGLSAPAILMNTGSGTISIMAFTAQNTVQLALTQPANPNMSTLKPALTTALKTILARLNP